ncbi:MAG: DEAD/DEAH box helicase family protein [Acidobacteria bacterium]|nr:DEAD/DEAH box helicase family protein [Acidobacteriota bacterium]
MKNETVSYDSDSQVRATDRVRVPSRPDLGVGEVFRVAERGGVYQADVVFETPAGRQVETLPIELLEKTGDLWDRLARKDFDNPEAYCLKQMATELMFSNSGGELTSSRVNLLPHQILLVHDVVAMRNRRLLIADEVGLGKTIETGMALRELLARGEADRILIITPAGLIKNWQRELTECFRLHFEILGRDFRDHGSASWEIHQRVIASIDTLKQPRRIQRLLGAPRWDVIVFDEAHHLSRTRSGNKTTTTQNYKLAEMLRGHTRDFLFLSATPHQGNAFQFWSLIQLLDDQLFATPEGLLDHRGLLGRVMIRRTKREVTDPEGKPVFRRRQVHTETFSLGPRERSFYERLSEYLREGYNAAGINQRRTTSQQRAIGFVMVTFQKIMSSSPRAIRQALCRRLLVVLTRRQLQLESRRRQGATLAEEIMKIQDEMLDLARRILGGSAVSDSDAEAYVGQVSRRLLRKLEETYERTSWSLDSDEDADEGVFAEADIPGEINKLRELIALVPEGTDRRFDTLLRAISDLSRHNRRERFVIFTQYRETMEFLRGELERIFGAESVARIRGGPLEDKIAAMEAFWAGDGARFLISTSAGGEGINLQVASILFNYDLPWNPMAVEQRIGRIHRYGQQETVQVYNLVAEDTVEERIYSILQAKLSEIALSIGKVDESGNPTEDFQSEILGYLGSRPDYEELYKRALVDKDYRRTEAEMQSLLEEALRAREALTNLTQDLSNFNLESFRLLEGRYSLEELGDWVKNTILHLGGAAMPSGEFWTFIVPESLQRSYRLSPRYDRICFDRGLALRTRDCELGGVGHPLVDSLMDRVRQPDFQGEVCAFGSGKVVKTQFLVQRRDERGRLHGKVFNLVWTRSNGQVEMDRRFDVPAKIDGNDGTLDFPAVRQQVEEALQAEIIAWLPDRQSRAGLQITLAGLHLE